MEKLELQLSPIAETVYRQLRWTPERDVDPTAHLEHIKQATYPIFPLAEAFLRQFSGLTTLGSHNRFIFDDQVFEHHGIPYRLWRMFENFIPAYSQHADYEAAPYWLNHPLIANYGRLLCPIGSYDVGSTIFLTSDGWIMTGQFYNMRWGGLADVAKSALKMWGTTPSEGLNALAEYAVLFDDAAKE
ncbi:SUKH-3 domain-containing protein [Herpetosiphon llansteffanensis]|uniref:SUKH-3 domain-containing protein n=1 Tax=Herpetosiphon llansteffanensis TaxID=2094568 RepID=UPI000D7C940F|nr:SUKH-3 domain-containing protein [Herpetosiphon llansteffanensis]